MKLVILIALLAQVFAEEPHASVPSVQNPHVHGVPQHVQHMAEHHISHVLQHVPKIQDHLHQAQQQKDEVKKNLGVPQIQNPHADGVPQHIQHMAEKHISHILQHVPQVQNHLHQLQHPNEVVKKNVPQIQNPHADGVPQQVQHMAEQHISHVLQHVPQVQNHVHQLQNQKTVAPDVHVPHVPGVPQNIQEFAKQHITHVLHNVPHVQNHIKEHHILPKPIPDAPNSPIHAVGHHVVVHAKQVGNEKVGVPVQQFPNVPHHVQQVIQQVHQHVPQVIDANVNKHRVPKALHVPSHVQNIVEHVHHHIPQVINQHAQLHGDRINDASKCSFQCTRLDLSICATNGKCWRQFSGLCEMSKWNCMNTERTFRQVDDAQCMDTAKPKCYPGDI